MQIILKSIFIGAYLVPGFCANMNGLKGQPMCGYGRIATIFIFASITFGIGSAVFFESNHY